MISILRKNKSYLYTFLLVLGMCFSVSLIAAVPEKSIGFQGQLYAYNAPVTNTVNATFTFYDALTDGTVTGSTISKVITVSNGYFGTTFSESDTTGVDFNQQLFLEVTINGTALTPRTSVNPTVSSLKTFGAFSYATPPTVGPVGSLYFNSTTNELYVSQGSSWQLAGLASSTTQWTPNGTTLTYMNGNVGIGTSTSPDLLHVSKDQAEGTKLRVSNYSPEIGAFAQMSVEALGSNGSPVKLFNYVFGTGYATSGRFIPESALIDANGAGGLGIASVQTRFYTSGNNERMRIDASGNIGIGTTSPTSRLHVYSADNTSGRYLSQIVNLDPTTTESHGLLVRGGANASLGKTFEVQDFSGNTDFIVTGDGNVGIGTTTPSSKLAVVGTITANGYSSPLAYGGFQIYDTTAAGTGVNIVGGYSANSIATGNIAATIVGGGTSGGTNQILSTAGTNLAYSFIGGGYDNKMDSAFPSVITGGAHNRINMATGVGFTTQVTGYVPNDVTDHSTISGGTYNAIFNTRYGTIGGGTQNALGHLGSTTDSSVIAGGTTNKINGLSSAIGGGSTNTINGLFSVIAGGAANTTSGGNSIFLGGGSSNSVNSGSATLGGGTLNTIASGGTTFGTYSFLGGGLSNTIGNISQSQYGVIIGGRSNSVNGDYSTILGGRDNVASSTYNLVAGRRAKTTASGAFAFSDSTDADFIVSTANMFGTRFSGGYSLTGGNVGIGTTTPSTKLEVVGGSGNTVRISGVANGNRTVNSVLEFFNAGTSANNVIAQISGLRGMNDFKAGQLGFFTSTASSGTLVEQMTINESGNVGIGTTTPGSKLVVSGGDILVNGLNNAVLTLNKQAATFSSTLNFNTLGTNVASIRSGSDGRFVVQGPNSTTTQILAGNSGILDLAAGSNGIITLSPNSTEAMRILANGNVGIGTSNPLAKVELSGASSTVLRFSSTDAGLGIDDIVGKIEFYKADGSTGGAGVPSFIQSRTSDLGGLFSLDFGVGSVTTPITAMSISGSGNVGIGTTTPTALLTLTQGTTAASGISFGGDTTLYRSGTGNLTVGGTSPIVLSAGLGYVYGQALANMTTANNALVLVGNTGTRISRNVADSNPALIVTQANASSTGDIFRLVNSTSSTVFTVMNSGNVGIGTASPSAKLSLYDITVNTSLTFQSKSQHRWWVTAAYDATTTPSMLSIGGHGSTEPTSGAINILTSGFVGIGTTSPSSLLFVNEGSAGAVAPFTGTLGTFSRNAAAYISILSPDANERGIFFGSPSSNVSGGIVYNPSGNTNGFQFRTGGNSIKMSITSAGNVGIGTSTPGYKLDVNGTVRLGTDGAGAFRFTDASFAQYYQSETNPRFVYDRNINPLANSGSGALLFNPASVFGGATSSATGAGFTSAGIGALAFLNGNGSTLVETMRILQNGNVGIGTTTPSTPLHVYSSSVTGITIERSSTGNSNILFKNPQGSVYVGIVPNQNGGFAIGPGLDLSTSAFMTILATGNVGIGTTTPSAQLTTTGTVRFASLGSGGANLITDSLGNVTVSSDERLKDIQGDFISGLDQIKGITPITYRWKTETGYDTLATYAGFSAQNVQANIPEAVTTDSRGFLTLADRPILAALVNAVKEIGGWFVGGKFTIQDDVCVDDFCMTKEEFKSMMMNSRNNNNTQPAPTPAPQTQQSAPTSTEEEPPAIVAPVVIEEVQPAPEPVVTPVVEEPAS